MIINGGWTEEKDYSAFPADMWCDMDHVAVWIREQGYTPKTSMRMLINRILNAFDEAVDNGEITSCRNPFWKINTLAIEAFVNKRGGIGKFDRCNLAYVKATWMEFKHDIEVSDEKIQEPFEHFDVGTDVSKIETWFFDTFEHYAKKVVELEKCATTSDLSEEYER